MARQLTKRTLAGVTMTRLPQVQVEVEELLRLTDEMLLERAAIATKGAKGYCSSEALVALYREACRTGNAKVVNGLIPRLTSHCSKLAKHKLFVRGIDSDEATQNVVDRFVDLLVAAAGDGLCEQLDFFEVLFDNAVTSLAASEARRAHVRYSRSVPISGDTDDDDAPNRDLAERVRADLSLPLGLTEPERGVFTAQVLAEIANLPEAQRTLAIMTVLGVQSESNDPRELTISATLDVQPKTVRNRQKRVAEKLVNFKE
ncbi:MULTISPECIES: hypothetical protein [unclassified Burkholderia]|uniref:hypothetical protein n=1 Tax=unclassified Burkholderia TaxID=2613784 RepID=UPI00198136C2|nr:MULTISPECIES: hypothetical protein [unclassified Burkholderia]MBN3769266.1 hypothetical protein [Burkholderia sp. Se-20378]MBN3793979.1 hypothetical protein [Burkholderia sp. Ac-20392]